MIRNNYKKKIKKILLDNKVNVKNYNDNVNLIENGVVDSMQIVTLISDFEKQFKIKIDQKYFFQSNFGSIKSFEKIIKILIDENKISKKK